MAALADVLVPLSEHLSMRDLFGLFHALGRDAARTWPPEVTVLMCRRMGLSLRWTVGQLGARMARRCMECGVPTQRVPRVCAVCEAEPSSFFCMCDRSYARRLNARRAAPIRNFEHVMATTFRIIKRREFGRHYYWKREVDAFVATHP